MTHSLTVMFAILIIDIQFSYILLAPYHMKTVHFLVSCKLFPKRKPFHKSHIGFQKRMVTLLDSQKLLS